MPTPRTSTAVIAYASELPTTQSGGRGTSPTGLPTQAFTKDLIRVGRFTHPATGQDFEITPDWLDNAVAQFGRMNAAGVKVHVPAGHSNKPEDNRGYVNRIYREGDRLMGVLEMIGDDAILMAGRNEVSIYAEPEFADGTGTVYPWAIQHVALTPVPVIPGQDSFRAIAASRDATPTNVPVFRLAAKGIAPMDNLLKLASKLGINPEGKDEATLWSECLAALDGASTKAEMTAVAAARDALQAERDTLQAERDTLQTKLAEATKAPEQPHPQVLKYARAHRLGAIDALVKDAKLTKDAGEALKGVYVGDEKGIALARTLDTENDTRFDALVGILDKLPPIRPLGKGGAVEASRNDPIDTDDNAADPKVFADLNKHSRYAVPATK